MLATYIYSTKDFVGEVLLDDCEYHHISRVLRKKTGDSVIVFDGNGKICYGELKLSNNCGYVINLSDVIVKKRTSEITLIQSLTNEPSTMDDVVRKATELGVSAFSPFIADRTEKKRWPQEKYNEKLKRLRQITIEACKQSKNPFLPKINQINTLINSMPTNCVNLYCSLENYASPLQNIHLINKNISVIIGPEGGFSAKEELLLKSSCIPIKLANTILKTDTAAISAIAQINSAIL